MTSNGGSYILIVEDHSDFRNSIKAFIADQRPDAQILEAESGELAVEKARRHALGFVLMDFQLPGINGIVTAQRIKDLQPKCKIILMTMFNTEEIKSFPGHNIVSALLSKTELYDQLIPLLRKMDKNSGNFADK